MARLAIKGHATRGKEVIELLEMMGGKQFESYLGNDISWCYTIINGEIDWDYPSDKYKVFTLEEFLKEFPYKVGDKVIAYAEGCLAQFKIQDMRWNDELNKVEYKIRSSWIDTGVIFTSSYKEETMEKEKKDYEEWFQTDYLEFENNDDTWADEVEVNLGKDYEIQIRGDKTFIVKKKPQYPKTYEECCKVLMGKTDFQDYSLLLTKLSTKINEANSISPEPPHITLINNFYKLLICRDAYWKIAGEQMGLGKPWEPNWLNTEQDKFVLYTHDNVICLNRFMLGHNVLAFPTKEMRDAFYENFKDLIEVCTELL